MSKKYLPRSLFGRALLILVLPTLFIQLVTAYIFFDRHLDNITRHMSSTLAGEAAFLVEQLKDTPNQEKSKVVKEFEAATGIRVSFEGGEFDAKRTVQDFPEFQEILREKITEEFTVRRSKDGEIIGVRIKLPNQILKLQTSSKRLESKTTKLFVLGMVGASILFLFIAVLFLRNQIRPITNLASAAESFGRGVDTPNFRPSGATEVRKAARAFITMRERIRRQIRTRTDMLSGISHDLRTPLTRMKLQLAMLPEEIVSRADMKEAIAELDDDVQQMQHMINEYLDFAKGESGEEAVQTYIGEFISDVVSDYTRMQQPVSLSAEGDALINIRISACRRMFHNIIDNALRYGKKCHVFLRISANYAEIAIDDEGAGIPEDKRIDVFKPFNRLEASRNAKTGGVGLGLTIAREIVQAHGGSIVLETAPVGGLRVLIRLPL